jgi:RHS repeat-associated protein
LPRARTRAKIASRKKFALYTPSAREKPRQVIKGTKENGRAYDKCASGGRFLSVDPVTTDGSTGSSFNRYAYGNNSPYKYVDPDGRNAIAVGIIGGGTILAIGTYRYLTDPKARAAINRLVAAAMSSGGEKKPSPAVGQGCIYCVPGDKTNSGKDYIGSTDDLDKRSKDTSDGRDRKGADVIDTYQIGDREERRRKEQQAINDKGGVSETDNKRNEIRETKWGEKGVEPPPPKPPEEKAH